MRENPQVERSFQQIILRQSRKLARFLKGQFKHQTEPKLLLISNRESSTPSVTKIPAHLIQTGPSKQLHEEHLLAIESFRDLNPDLSHEFFDNNAADEYMATNWEHHPIKAIYDRCEFGQMKADIFRYCIVFDRGGYYLDINKTVNAQLTSLLPPDAEGIISFEKNDLIVLPSLEVSAKLSYSTKVVLQWCFGFQAQHPVLGKAIERIVELEPLFAGKPVRRALHGIVSFTGPGVFTWAVHQYLASSPSQSLVQVAPDFDGLGVTRLKHSEKAFTDTHYGPLKDQVILRTR